MKNESNEVNWYSEERRDNFIDLVILNRGSSKIKLMECDYAIITDVYFNEDTIFIKMHQLNDIYFFKDKAMGFFVKIDSSANHRDWLKVYQPDEYKRGGLSDSDVQSIDRITRSSRMRLNIVKYSH